MLVVICSIAVSSSLLTGQLNKISAFIAAVSAALMTFLLPNKRAIVYAKASALLDKHISYYEHGEKYALKFVIEAKNEGEKIISRQDLIGELPNIK